MGADHIILLLPSLRSAFRPVTVNHRLRYWAYSYSSRRTIMGLHVAGKFDIELGITDLNWNGCPYYHGNRVPLPPPIETSVFDWRGAKARCQANWFPTCLCGGWSRSTSATPSRRVSRCTGSPSRGNASWQAPSRFPRIASSACMSRTSITDLCCLPSSATRSRSLVTRTCGGTFVVRGSGDAPH